MDRLTAWGNRPGAADGPDAAPWRDVLGAHAPSEHAEVVLRADAGGALVWRGPDGSLGAAALGWSTPVVDDPVTWGRIAALDAAGALYARGARPRFALDLVAWPDELPADVLAAVLRGGADAASQGGWVVGGGSGISLGHPCYGQAVFGDVAADALLVDSGARPGDLLILTQPVGTGVVSTAAARVAADATAPGGPLAALVADAVASMLTPNDAAARAAIAVGSGACTAVGGAGLLGQVHHLAVASGVRAVVDPAEVPTFEGAWALIDAGHVPAASERNLAGVRDHLDDGGHDAAFVTMLVDPQTSGGLLFSCAPERAEAALAQLGDAGLRAEDIGEIVAVGDGRPGDVLLR